MTIFKTDKNPHFFAPFGPTMGYFKMPDNLVNFLNKSMDKKLDDFSDHLVGKVTQELHFDKDILILLSNKRTHQGVQMHLL